MRRPPRAAGSGSRTSRPLRPSATVCSRRGSSAGPVEPSAMRTRWRSDSSAGSASGSREPGRYTPITSTSRCGGGRAREARRAAAAAREPVDRPVGQLAGRALEASPRVGHVAGVAGQERGRIGQGRSHRGRSVSTTRPAEFAPMTTPCGQARRSVCQPQPTSTRSSRARPGARAAAEVGLARRAAALERHAGERPQGRVVRVAPVVQARAGEVHDPAAGRAQAEQPVLLVAVQAVARLVELARPARPPSGARRSSRPRPSPPPRPRRRGPAP